MAIVATAATSAVFGPVGGTTSAISTVGANLIIVGIWYQAISGANLTDSLGNTWTPLATRTNFSLATKFYYCVNPTVGASHTFSTTSHFVGVGVLAVSGASSSPFDQDSFFGQNGPGTIQPGALTPSENNCLVVTAFGSFNGVTPAAGPVIPTGYTQVARNTTSTAEAGGMGYKIQTAAASENPSWTSDGSSEIAMLAIFKAAPASGGNTGNFFLLFNR